MLLVEQKPVTDYYCQMFSRIRHALVALLRWSEHYTKTDMLYLAKGGSWLMLGQGTLAASGLVLSVAFANLLSKEVYGAFQFVMAGAVILSALTLSDLGTALARTVARGNRGALRFAVRTMFRWSGVVVLASAALATYYYINGNDTLALSFLIVGCFAPLLNAYGLTKHFLYGAQLFRDSAVAGLWRRAIPVVALLLAAFLTDNPALLVLTYFVSHSLSAWFLYRFFVRRYGLPYTEEPDMVDYAKHLSFLSIASTVASQLDKVLIWTMIGAAPLAAYTLAQLPVKHLESLFRLLQSLTFPKLSAARFEDLHATLPHKVRLLLLGAFVLAACYAVAAPFLFATFFPAYPESVLMSQALVLVLLSKPRSMYMQAMVAHKRKRAQYIVSLSSTALRVILMFAFIQLWGVWGIIYAILLNHLYINIATRIFFARAAPAENEHVPPHQ